MLRRRITVVTGKILVLAAMFLLCPAVATAGSLKGSYGLGAIAASGDADLNDEEGVAGANAYLDFRYSSNVTVKGDFLLQTESLGQEPETFVRELYGNYSWDSFELTAGRVIEPWGRADIVNPTDNLSPKHLRSVVTDDDERRLGADMVKLEYAGVDPFLITAVWVPDLQASILPQDLPRQYTQASLSPDSTASTYAVKLDYLLTGIDGSFSYLDGAALLPAFRARDGQVATYRPQYRVAGADLFWQINEYYGLRSEFARTWFDSTNDPVSQGPEDFDLLVLGVERQMAGGWLASLQYVGRRVKSVVPAFEPVPAIANRLNDAFWFQANGDDDAIAFTVSRAPFYGAVSGEFGTLYSLSEHDQGVFVTVKWQVTPQLSVHGYHEDYLGASYTNFGALKDNQLTALEIRMTFGY